MKDKRGKKKVKTPQKVKASDQEWKVKRKKLDRFGCDWSGAAVAAAAAAPLNQWKAAFIQKSLTIYLI